MERKAFNSLNEAALQVQYNETHDEQVPDMVLEYFESYFGGTLNESTSDEDIMEAVYDLVDLTEAVCEAVGLDEKSSSQAIRHANVEAGKANRLIDAHGQGREKTAQELETSGVAPRARKTRQSMIDRGKRTKVRRDKYIQGQIAGGKPDAKKNIERAKRHDAKENQAFQSLSISGGKVPDYDLGDVRPHRTSSQGQRRIYDIDTQRFRK